MNKIFSIKHITGFIVFGMFLLGLSGIAFAKDLVCKSPKVRCCPGGVQSCCQPLSCTTPPCEEYSISCFSELDDPLEYNDDLYNDGDLPLPHGCTPGKERYNATDCSFNTDTCCNDRTWSGYGKKCCNDTKPATSQTCTKTNGVEGTQTRTVSCDKNTGNWNVGDWTTCSGQDCTPGQTSTQGCSTYRYGTKEKTCRETGYWGGCQCPTSTGNGMHDGRYYCQGTQTVEMEMRELGEPHNGSCWHGIWSDTTCSGICCCKGDTPKLMNDGSPGCWGKSRGITGGDLLGDDRIQTWQDPCTCVTAEEMESWHGDETGQFRL